VPFTRHSAASGVRPHRHSHRFSVPLASLLLGLVAVHAWSPGAAHAAGPVVAPAARVPGPAADPCAVPADYKPLDQCIVTGRDATVGTASCPNAYVTGTALTGANALGAITINAGATLMVANATTALDTTGIDVAGTLQVGTPACPIARTNQVTVKFLGAKPPACARNAGAGSKACHTKGIYVQSGGSLVMNGKGGAGAAGVSWTRLTAPAGPVAKYGTGTGVQKPALSATKLSLPVDISADWPADPWVVVGTTDFASYNSEFVQLTTSGPRAPSGGTTYDVKTGSLQNYHFGGLPPTDGPASYNDGADRNYGIDERAEVGLISRNIKLTADIPDAASLHWGGEITITEGFNRVDLQGVEIEKFGKDQLGSYPIHFHMVGTPANPPVVDRNSIHHSYNKCIVLHMSSGLTISNNVCARIVGHMFYLENGSEANNTFRGNLGLGAMQNYFPMYLNTSRNPATNVCTPNAPESFVPPTPAQLDPYFWNGDFLANPALYPSGAPPIAYDGYNIPNWDTQTNFVRGQCYKPDGSGTGTPCTATADTDIYFEPASGFWLTNPTTNLVDNAISGCQGVGRAIWYLPTDTNYRLPLGQFRNNSARACYNGLDTAADNGLISQNLAPQNPAQQDLIAVFDSVTASRNRFKGVWVRPNWNLIDGARLATNYEGVSLVSSGGTEGSAPGVWGMLSNSVLAGMSTNNPDRFGPCPSDNGHGCLCENPGLFTGQGYPVPSRNFQGYMFYDGPARIVTDRFVNFNRDITPVLSNSDKAYLADYVSRNKLPFDATKPFVYEGDAAFGWIQSNLQSVPPTQYTDDLRFENTDLRHQVYTEAVNLGAFQDGDKNTVILDKDGTLTGYRTVSAAGERRTRKFPVSLNNLAFLGADDRNSAKFPNNPSTVDECLASGGQDPLAENRETSLISPFDYATLETSVLTCAEFPSSNAGSVSPPGPAPTCANADTITFVKDMIDYGKHQSMTLSGRNGNGIYEPKVGDGWGYTLHKQPNGFPRFFTLGLVDANTENLATNPFNVRVGVCMKTQAGTIPPADNCAANPASCTPNFTVQRGYKSYGGPNNNNPTLTAYWNFLPQCNNLDNQVFKDVGGTLYKSNIPTPAASIAGCPSPSQQTSGRGPVNLPVVTLKQAATIAGVDADHYFYDATRGLLFLQVSQSVPNAMGPSPLGSCTSGSPLPCPQVTSEGETFYSCPPEGCILYTVTVNSPAYSPSGATDCKPYDGTAKDDGSAGYTMVYPDNTDRLAYVVPAGKSAPNIADGMIAKNVAVPSNVLRGVNYPHNKPVNPPYCANVAQ